ncbi:MAG: AhpC/TSA family protein [Gemmatimonadales bacterium]
MHDLRARIARVADVVVVTYDDPDAVRAQLLHGIDLTFPVALDPTRGAYRAWGMATAAWWRIWLDPMVWWHYASMLASGERIRGSGSHTLQMGGDFVVAPDGTVAYARPQVRDDRPPVTELIAVASRLGTPGGGRAP